MAREASATSPGLPAVQSSGRPVMTMRVCGIAAACESEGAGPSTASVVSTPWSASAPARSVAYCHTPPTASAVISRRSGPRRIRRTDTPPPPGRPRLSRQGLGGPEARGGPDRRRSRQMLVRQPAGERRDAGAPWDRGSQLEGARRAARVGDVVALIAGAPIGEGQLDRPADQILDMAQELPQADGVRWPAAEVEGAALHGVDAAPRRKIGLDGIGDVEHVAHLTPVAVDRDRFSFESADQEMRHPALVLGPHLARAIDAAHAHDCGRHAEAAGIVEDVLVGGALRAAIGRVEIERSILADALRAHRRIARQIGFVGLVEDNVGEIAVDLVGRGEDEGGRVVPPAQRLEQAERALHVDVEILARRDEARRHRDLRREMEHRLGVPRRGGDAALVADVADHARYPLRMAALEPGEIALHPGPREGVVDEDVVALAGEPVGEVRADEPGAAGDEDRAASDERGPGRGARGRHATSPLSSSSLRASWTRSSASCRATHSASAASPCAKSRFGAKPSSWRAFAMSAIQCRMSPARAWPAISGPRRAGPMALASNAATSRTERSSPLAML